MHYWGKDMPRCQADLVLNVEGNVEGDVEGNYSPVLRWIAKVARVKRRESNCNLTINFFTCEIIPVSQMTLT